MLTMNNRDRAGQKQARQLGRSAPESAGIPACGLVRLFRKLTAVVHYETMLPWLLPDSFVEPQPQLPNKISINQNIEQSPGNASIVRSTEAGQICRHTEKVEK